MQDNIITKYSLPINRAESYLCPMVAISRFWAKLYKIKSGESTCPVMALGLFLAVLASLTLAVPVAHGAAGPWAENDHSRLRLVATTDALGPEVGSDQPVVAGLQFQLAPNWKIYWRSPGDAGFPPSLDWAGSENFAGAEMEWPIPKRFSLFGLETFGYGDEIVLPLLIQPQVAGSDMALTAEVNYLICEEICIPYTERVSLDLPAGPAASSPEASLVDQFRGLVPRDGGDAGLRLAEAVLTGDMDAPILRVRAEADAPFAAPDLLVEGPPSIFFAKPTVALADDGHSVTFEVASEVGPLGGVLEGKQLTLTVIDGDRGMEQVVLSRFGDGSAAVGPGSGSTGQGSVTFAALAAILGTALLGGLILNLMPCVLPVLSIKLLSVVKQSGRARGHVRGTFMATAAGVIFSFLLLALLAVVLKNAGLAVGWGIQFQQPVFLIFMTLLLVLFACNLFGFFEIPLPAWLGDMSTQGPQQGYAGAFATGAFATLLATPCSAPFLGTAVGFALSRGALEIFLIFAFLGLGLALPYLLVAAFPGVANKLPKPGAWMVTVRKVLALPLLATALWLLSVLWVQAGDLVAVVAGLLLVALSVVLWRGHAARAGSQRASLLASPVLAGVLSLAVLAVPIGLADHERGGPRDLEHWGVLDEAAIRQSVADGKVVFVDVTADWCITCQVNKRAVLDQDEVMARLLEPDVVLQRGDWTLPSDAITAYLNGHGRYGIPFNAVYGPGAPEGIALPEILTRSAVMEALEKAGGG